ncbi:signal peptidase I [Candidatus Kaiserbacteria bacterium RIFCSPHIGHO2_01_FULL_55_17]|uniref:Signal peptidase I n=1 Tax=Candidatus Kaiserbacteria bacterium RIFCSPHIGHO2_01_FULL_55_17 TaxID=1798484 RepID=A0A1F6D999_9BACT|nr:MAG: signal peptidase I [Candidatus Kaiserbacteria bacterium RIFCSPHIGHO2_01_FULL_55_17]
MNDSVMQGNTSQKTQKENSQGSLLGYTVVALGLALFIRFFVAAPYVVSGASMDPGFEDWHYLIIDRVSYDLGDPQRGDVIVFDLPQEGGRSLIKRVIGLSGETVVLKGQSVKILNDAHPDGLTLEEPYLDPENLGGTNDMRVTLGADEYFVLGDNRRVSADSRVWGTLPRENIVGRAFVRLYPLDKISLLPEEARYEE